MNSNPSGDALPCIPNITIFLYHCSDGLDVTLSTISARMVWEEAFDNAYIKPTLEVNINSVFNLSYCITQDLEANVQEAQLTIMNDSGHGTV